MMKPNDEKRNGRRPTEAANKVVEVYSDNGQTTDPLGMYTGRPADASIDYVEIAIPRYDTEAVRYCNGKRYMRPEKVDGYNVPTQDADDL